MNKETVKSVLGMGGEIDPEAHTCRPYPGEGDPTIERPDTPGFLELDTRSGHRTGCIADS